MARSVKPKALGDAAAQAGATVAQAVIKGAGGLPTGSALTPTGATFIAPMRAGFDTATSGNEQRLSWARSSIGELGAMGWGAGGPTFYSLQGGRTARDAVKASNISNEIATRNPLTAIILINATTQAIVTGLTLSSKQDAADINISP